MLRNSRTKQFKSRVGVTIEDQKELNAIAAFRRGFLDYQAGMPYANAYEKWSEKAQTNYENGRAVAGNIASAMPKKHFKALQWLEYDAIPLQISQAGAFAHAKVGGAQVTNYKAIIEEMEAYAAGYDRRRGLPLPVPEFVKTQ